MQFGLNEIIGGRTVKLKVNLVKNTGGAWGGEPRDDGSNVTVLRSTEQTSDGLWRIANPATRHLSKNEYESTKLTIGDLLVTKSSGSELHIGKTTIVDESAEGASYSNFMQRLRVRHDQSPRYYWYYLNSNLAREQYNYSSNSTSGLGNLSSQIFSNLEVPLLSVALQQKVVDFLDGETAKIDNLIAKQERLLELLEEKRRATITHAVTRGLNPSVELKETNIPWLSEIPQHWHVVAARRLFAQRKERAFPGQEQLTASQKYGVITQRNYMDREKVRIVIVEKDHEILKQVEPGDFVISMRSFQGGLEYSRLRGSISSAYVMLFRLKDINDEYFKYLFKCDGYIQMLQSTSNLIRDGQAMRYANFIQVPLPLPPKDEQKDIAIYLDKENANCNQLKQKIQTQITLLRERRISLISHAVTGKIKV